MRLFLSNVLLGLGGAMLLPAAVGTVYGEDSPLPFVCCAGGTALLGIAVRPRSGAFVRRAHPEAILVFSWLVVCLLGAVPYLATGATKNPLNAVFESTSGFSTTGSTVFSDPETLSRGILFWRSLTHALGGMGILLMVLIFLPARGEEGARLAHAEGGFTSERLTPRLVNTGRILAGIYWLLILVETFLLLMGGLGWYDALCTALGTISTGGFSPRTASIGHYGSLYVELVVMLFMFLGAVNFVLHFRSWESGPRAFWKSEVLRTYAGVLLVSCLTVAAFLWISGTCPNGLEALRYGSFSVVSIGTTTGFANTGGFGNWPVFCHLLLLGLMVAGTCVGSTGGGIKWDRILLAVRWIWREICLWLHPREVLVVRVDGKPVAEETVRRAVALAVAWIVTLFLASLGLAACGFTSLEAIGSSASALANEGPSFGRFTTHFADAPAAARGILCACMFLGRLELFAVLALFVRKPGA